MEQNTSNGYLGRDWRGYAFTAGAFLWLIVLVPLVWWLA